MFEETIIHLQREANVIRYKLEHPMCQISNNEVETFTKLANEFDQACKVLSEYKTKQPT